MKVETRELGVIEIERKELIRFEEGIPGFEEEKEFIIIEDTEKFGIFKMLQSVKEKDICLVIINPLEVFDDYDIKLDKSTINKLKIKSLKDVEIYVTVVLSDDIKKSTANLVGPIIINRTDRLGKQVVQNTIYTTKHLIFPNTGGYTKC